MPGSSLGDPTRAGATRGGRTTTVNVSADSGAATIGHMRLRSAVANFALMTAAFMMIPASFAQTRGLERINHVIVIYQENWSFDSLYGHFPGANGLDQAGAAVQQVDKNGPPYPSLPQPLNTSFSP